MSLMHANYFVMLYTLILVLFVFAQVLSADGTQEVGKISKQWSGLAKEFFTKADNFGVQCKFDISIPFESHVIVCYECSSHGS